MIRGNGYFFGHPVVKLYWLTHYCCVGASFQVKPPKATRMTNWSRVSRLDRTTWQASTSKEVQTEWLRTRKARAFWPESAAAPGSWSSRRSAPVSTSPRRTSTSRTLAPYRSASFHRRPYCPPLQVGRTEHSAFNRATFGVLFQTRYGHFMHRWTCRAMCTCQVGRLVRRRMLK